MNLIVNVDKNWAIGCNDSLLVYIKGDLQRFKEMTTGKVIVYGRRTMNTFPDGKPLPNRKNIVLTSDGSPLDGLDDVETAASIEELLQLLGKYDPDNVFVIGGESVYRQLLPYCRKAYVTKFDGELTADCHFPILDAQPGWELVAQSEIFEEDGIHYNFNLYQNNSPLE